MSFTGSASDLSLQKSASWSTAGMVAAKTPQAAAAGAATLRSGGNAIDAAVVTALVSAVCEPWMNGIGGGGFLMRHDSNNNQTSVVEYPMVAPQMASADMYKLQSDQDGDSWFGWADVVDMANSHGPISVAVPGTLAGLALALEEYGTISLAKALEPAIDFAENGFPYTWHSSMQVSRDLAWLNRFEGSRAIFCPEGVPVYSQDSTAPAMLRQTDLAATLRTIADQGARAFYEGELAERLVADLQAGGSPISTADLAGYQAVIKEAISRQYGDCQVHSTGGATGGSTLLEALALIERSGSAEQPFNSPEALHLMAQAFRVAFADRFAYLADPDFVDVPYDTLLSDDYLDLRAREFTTGRVNGVCPGSREVLGVGHSMPGSMPNYSANGCTTHLSVIDDNGVAVSLTQTHLDLWGSRYVVPGTGVLMNNGMYWFDPVPGRPNSVAGGKKPLANMCPSMITRDGQAVAAIGASGGRRIIGCLAQIASNQIDRAMPIQAAVSAPRIDYSTPSLQVSWQIEPETADRLSDLGHTVVRVDERLLAGGFASPACVQAAGDNYFGGVDPYYFPATAEGA